MSKTTPHHQPPNSLLPLLHLTLIIILGLTHLTICNGASSKDPNSSKRLKLEEVSSRFEDGTEMDSESNRRLLMMMQPRRYVSYDTLRKDLVPCERSGASYYNCRSGGVANPYTRGCEVIAGCARSIRDIQT